jgi:L-ascorbate metabolism protein UlaG (beta-lactamase superfamily)
MILRSTLITFFLLLTLTACTGAVASAPSDMPLGTDVDPPATVETKEETIAEKPADIEPEVTIIYEGNAQFELINSAGTRVLLDVASPDNLTGPATSADILLTTHGHRDHVNSDFLESFPGQQLNAEQGQINLADVSIKSIKSAHNANNELDGSNYIFVVDMAGLRIAHFGDIGQAELTPEQLDVLGDVDIALTQFKNGYSQMDTFNKKGFNLMAQLQPRLIIPHHGNESKDVVEMAIDEFGEVYVTTNPVTVSRSTLPDQTTMLIIQDEIMATAFKNLFDLSDWQTRR